MNAAERVGVDLIQELRLRKWARDHYVPVNERNRHWHPVVLEEMEFRDNELVNDFFWQDLLAASFVPLEPTDLRYDEAHPAIPAPKLPLTIDAAEELVLRAGRAALRLREDGDVELVGSRISAASRGLFRLVGRILRLN